MSNIKIEIIAKGEILISRPEKFLINFSTTYEDIEKYFGKPYREKIGVLSYPDKKIEQKDIVFENPVIVLTYYNNILSMIDIHRSMSLFYNDINLLAKPIDKIVKDLDNIGIAHVYFDDITILFPKLNIFINVVENELQNIGIYKDGYFDQIKNDEIRYKLLNSKKENGILTYYFDYKDKK